MFMCRYRKGLRFLLALSLFILPIKTLFAASYNWQGPYLGAYLGLGVGSHRTSTSVGSATDVSYFTTTQDINAVNSSGESNIHPVNAVGGLKGGYNWICKKIVCGVAMDYGSFSFDAANQQNSVYKSSTDQYSIRTAISSDWLFTLRAKLGYPIVVFKSPSLLYVTGGVAFARFEINNTFSDNSSSLGVGSVQNNLNEIGWAAGLGIDIARLKHLIWDFGYLYVDMPYMTTTGTISNSVSGFGFGVGAHHSPFTTTNGFRANIVKMGLSYHFDE